MPWTRPTPRRRERGSDLPAGPHDRLDTLRIDIEVIEA